MMRRIWWLVAVAAVSGCGDDFVGPCVPDDAGNGCDGGTSPDGGGAAGTNSGTSGTGSTNDRDGGPQADTGTDPMDDDAGEDMPPVDMDAAVPMDAAQPTPDAGSDAGSDSGANPPDSRTAPQLAPCEAFEEGACAEGLGCYVRGNGPGFCTATCEDDEDCEVLTDAEYTCSTTFGGGQGGNGGMGLCRIECEGENDTESCPGSLECISVGGQGGQGNGGAFRCGYTDDPPDQGEGTVARWGRCTESDADCAGNLVRYSTFQENADGFCTDTCENNDDCSEDPGSGDIDPTCGTQNECRFDCAEGGTCPDGMGAHLGPLHVSPAQ